LSNKTKINSLIDLHISGKSARHLIDALVEELPTFIQIQQAIKRELPKGSKVEIHEHDRAVFISCRDRHLLNEKIQYFEIMYPELEFIIIKQ
jgi:hypothetical protein